MTVGLASEFLLKCQVTSTQRTQLTFERLDLALHGGEVDGIDLTAFFSPRIDRKSRLPQR